MIEEDLGYGSFPAHRDIRFVGDLFKIGAPALKMRFREVDPAIWDWLFDELGGLR